jgi:thiamine biosynthesis protein ThiS
MALKVTLNGEPRQLDAPTSVRALLESLGLDPAKIAVERNLEIVPKSLHAATPVAAGDRIELVQFVGGG